MSKLEKMLSSNIPEAKKETLSNELQKKINELQSQLASIKHVIAVGKSAST